MINSQPSRRNSVFDDPLTQQPETLRESFLRRLKENIERESFKEQEHELRTEIKRLEERLLRLVQTIPDEDIAAFWEEANAVMGDVDTEDVLFVAAALSREEAAVWSDDKHFEKQDRVD